MVHPQRGRRTDRPTDRRGSSQKAGVDRSLNPWSFKHQPNAHHGRRCCQAPGPRAVWRGTLAIEERRSAIRSVVGSGTCRWSSKASSETSPPSSSMPTSPSRRAAHERSLAPPHDAAVDFGAKRCRYGDPAPRRRAKRRACYSRGSWGPAVARRSARPIAVWHALAAGVELLVAHGFPAGGRDPLPGLQAATSRAPGAVQGSLLCVTLCTKL